MDDDEMARLVNLVWPIGTMGINYEALCSINAVNNLDWTWWRPYEFSRRIYYIKNGHAFTRLGKPYQCVATRCDDGKWMCGVVDSESANKWGIHEYCLMDQRLKNIDDLFSAAIERIAA